MPPEALDACKSLSDGAACSVRIHDRTIEGTCRKEPTDDDGHVTVLVVARVRDLAVTSYDLRGVHWRYAASDPRYKGLRWIFLTARAEPPVLAHELAHYFGVPHDPAGGNLMTPGPSAPEPHRSDRKPFAPELTPAQAGRLRAGIARFLRERARPGPPAAVGSSQDGLHPENVGVSVARAPL